MITANAIPAFALLLISPAYKGIVHHHSIFKKAEKETLSQQICLLQTHLYRAVVIKAVKNAKKRGALMAKEGQ